MAETWPARTVVVDTIRRARCTFCEWRGGEHEDYARANAERQAHLTWHRLGSPDKDGPRVAGCGRPCCDHCNNLAGDPDGHDYGDESAHDGPCAECQVPGG